MTVLEVIQRSSEFLARKGVESPRLQIEILLAQLLGLPRLSLYMNFDRVLREAEVTTLREQVARRGERVPLQHILGSTSFCGLEMAVGPEVLIPRPETELLVEAAAKWAEAQKGTGSGVVSILDFGTGSGCIAIALAHRLGPACSVVAMDCSPEALSRAQHNAERHQVLDRIQFVRGESPLCLKGQHVFDLVVSNPPYIPSGVIHTLEPEVRLHDPMLALDGGEDGLNFYRLLSSELPDVLRAGGRCFLELGDDQAEAVQNLMQQQNWIVEAIRPDYNQTPRVLIAKRD